MPEKLQYAVKPRHRLRTAWVGLQREAARLALNAQVLGAGLGFDAEGEEVPVVGAVPDEEGARRFGAEKQVGLGARHRAPIESTLLQLMDRTQHQVVLAS